MEKEKFFESVRGKVVAFFVAIATILALFGNAFPDWGLPEVVDISTIMPLVNAAAFLLAVFIWGRTQRNTKVK